MIVSWNWLRQYLKLEMSVEELADRLSLTGLNHEETTTVKDEFGDDLAIDLEVTSNRADCQSHLGVAREIGVAFQIPCVEPVPEPPTHGDSVEHLARVDVEVTDLCPRFTGRVITGITIGPSPWWLKRRLATLGQNSINNVVDITNYVMFECGQPLHAYDLETLQGHRLVIRLARGGETLRAINETTYELDESMLVIADQSRPVGLAGVMGGQETEVSASTTSLLIEAAQFDPLSVRRTSRRLGLRSEASFRFERGLDPERTEWASRRCSELILELAGGTLHPGLLDLATTLPEPPTVTLRFDQIARILGIPIEPETAKEILKQLGLTLLEQRDGDRPSTTWRPPSWRSDLEREIDLIEEVGRIYGYEKIPETVAVPLTRSALGTREWVEFDVRNALTGFGFDEAYTFSLVPEPLSRPLSGERPSIQVAEPRDWVENGYLRQSLLPSLIRVRCHNEANSVEDPEFFEIANVYQPRDGDQLPYEPARLALLGTREFHDLKGVVEELLERLHVSGRLVARPFTSPLFVPGQGAELRLDDDPLGWLGVISPESVETYLGAEAHREIRKTLKLRSVCAAAELEFELLIARSNLSPQYRPVPRYPAVSRDLSLIVDRELPWAEIAEAASSAVLEASVEGLTLEDLAFLDTFDGAGIPEGRQSVHFGLRFRHPQRTLTSDEVESVVRQIVRTCQSRFEASLQG